MYTLDYVKIGKRIGSERKKKQLTQSRLAELVNMSNEHISHIENGKTKLSLPALVEICNALSISADFVLLDSLRQTDAGLNRELAIATKGASSEELRLIVELAKTVRKLSGQTH